MQGIIFCKYNIKCIKTRRLQPAGFFWQITVRHLACKNSAGDFPGWEILPAGTEVFMNYVRTGLNRNVFYTILRHRLFLPYGRIMPRSSYFALLNYDKKVLINTGVIENQPEIEFILDKAGLKFMDIDIVINMTSRPEHIGLNAVIQYYNKKARFYTHPDEADFIENTVLQREERFIPGFFKLVAGNTEGVTVLNEGREFDLGGERLKINFNHNKKAEDGRFKILLEESGLIIKSDEIKSAAREKPANQQYLKAG